MKQNLRRVHPTLVVLTGIAYLHSAARAARAARLEDPEAGQVTSDTLAWIIFGVVIIAGLAAAITGVGQKVIADITNQLNL